ncbi:hypothetical protein [Enterococcus timonensis]|uniref:hypothetical protein n=1 Tax=Enterococcus timonensis TaxID=1852364 RepID=UPI0008DA3C76|nr:hypothetical protein [Enterococcus timonensis]
MSKKGLIFFKANFPRIILLALFVLMTVYLVGANFWQKDQRSLAELDFMNYQDFEFYQQEDALQLAAIKEDSAVSPEEITTLETQQQLLNNVMEAYEKNDRVELPKAKLSYLNREGDYLDYWAPFLKYLVAHDLPEYTLMENSTLPGLQKITSEIETFSKKFLNVLLLLALGISFIATFSKRSKTIDFDNLSPKKKVGLLLKKIVTTETIIYGLFLGSFLVVFLIATVKNGVGYWNYPVPLSAPQLTVTTSGAVISWFLLYSFLLIFILVVGSFLLQLFSKSIIAHFGFLSLFLLASQAPFLGKYEKFLPSTYLYFYNIFSQETQAYYFFRGTKTPEALKAAERSLSFLPKEQGALFLVSVVVLLGLISVVVVRKRQRI